MVKKLTLVGMLGFLSFVIPTTAYADVLPPRELILTAAIIFVLFVLAIIALIITIVVFIIKKLNK